MTTWQIIMIPVVLMAIGLIRQILILREKYKRLRIANEFLNKFLEWCESQNHSLYNWMLKKSEIIQAMLGTGGVIDFQRPFESDYHRNVPIILNFIPEIKQELQDDGNIQHLTQTVNDCLRRFMGLAEDQIQREKIRLLNPLVLFCGGVACLVELPLFILSETKIISNSRRTIITNGRIFALLSGIAAITAFIATVMGIVMNWEKFTAVITGG